MLSGLAVLLTSFAAFFHTTINNFPLRNWDEAWYAEIIKNMASGRYGYLASFWNGRYYFDKPPLYFWLSLPFFKLFGPGEWQARIVSAVAGILATLLVYLIGKKLFNSTAGFVSSLIFLTLGQVVVRFAHGNLDALLVCLSLASFYFYLLSTSPSVIPSVAKDLKRFFGFRPQNDIVVGSRFFSILTGASLGLGFLTKGWLPGLFPVFWITLYSITTTKKLPTNLGFIIPSTLATSGWWYLLGALRFGKDFVNWYLLNPGGNLLAHPLSSFSLSYFRDLSRDIGFWFILVLISAILLHFQGIRTLSGQAHLKGVISASEKKILYSFLLAIILFILSLNFLSEKLGWYNLPAYPLVAILIGYFASRLIKIAPKLTFFLIGLLTVAQIYNINRIENIYPDRSKVGATVGLHAKDLIPKEDTVILDNHDFTSFLYYSDHKEVYMVQNGGGKPDEWWILNYKDLPNFLNSHKKTWIVTPNINNLTSGGKLKMEDQYEGYTFFSYAN